MYSTLRKYIRATLQNLLLEPDQLNKEPKAENTLAMGGIRGATGPMGTESSLSKKKADIGSKSFGGGEYDKGEERHK